MYYSIKAPQRERVCVVAYSPIYREIASVVAWPLLANRIPGTTPRWDKSQDQTPSGQGQYPVGTRPRRDRDNTPLGQIPGLKPLRNQSIIIRLFKDQNDTAAFEFTVCQIN